MTDEGKKDVVREQPLSSDYHAERKYTYGDYLTWPDAERYEIIDGKVYDMSAAPLRRHQEILGALFAEFFNYLKGKPCKVYVAPFDVRIPDCAENDEDVQNVVQPDLSVFCNEDKLDAKGAKGDPDLVVEVISPSTLKKDLMIKKSLYERAGVREYWLVYPAEKAVLVYGLDKQGIYENTESYGEDDIVKVGIFDDFSIDLNAIFEE